MKYINKKFHETFPWKGHQSSEAMSEPYLFGQRIGKCDKNSKKLRVCNRPHQEHDIKRILLPFVDVSMFCSLVSPSSLMYPGGGVSVHNIRKYTEQHEIMTDDEIMTIWAPLKPLVNIVVDWFLKRYNTELPDLSNYVQMDKIRTKNTQILKVMYSI